MINIVLAAIVYAGVFPALMANGTADADLAWKVTGVVFLVGLLSALLVHFGFSASRSGERSVQELADAVRQPVLLLDGMNRYLMINREAEALFGLSRENDSGRAVDPRIAAALDGDSGRTGKLTTTTVIECNDHHFQVTDHPLPTPDAGGGRSRLVILREVDNEMRLKGAIRAINKTMASLSANATTISNSALSLSQGATEQANSLFSITATMDEFSRKIQGGSETAAKSTQLAAGAKEAAERSGNEIANALAAMTDVQDAGVRIARIVKLIDDIAFQTNLLALNAAVEAARAGRQGKGFAVVADEVRNLAGRSAKAAKDTAGMVEDVTERIGNATSFISRLEEMLRNIVQDTIRMADSSATASATSAEQASGIMQVNRELGQMNSVTNSTMSAAEQTATAVETLARQVASLKEK
ncbi:MAG: methyl-accepting chemotaxis protein, partial [Planctomycetes bacterium]|nr:methyl-accepting chemotaxis protein [Planctomycetota bacterium]